MLKDGYWKSVFAMSSFLHVLNIFWPMNEKNVHIVHILNESCLPFINAVIESRNKRKNDV